MALKPEDFPEWATSGTNVTEPSSGLKISGWVPGDRPPAQFTNWLHALANEWIQYMEASRIKEIRMALVNNVLDTNFDITDTVFGFTLNTNSGGGFPFHRFIAVGEGIWSSGTGFQWFADTVGGGFIDNFLACASSATHSVAVGENQEIQVSSNTTSWTQVETGGAQDYHGVAYSTSLNLFCAVGSNGLIKTATHAVVAAATAWTTRTPSSSYTGTFKAITWDAVSARFFAVGTGGEIQSSADGNNWDRELTGGGDIEDIASTEGKIVASLASEATILWREALNTWNSVSVNHEKLVTAAHGVFVLPDQGVFRLSNDGGKTWTNLNWKGTGDVAFFSCADFDGYRFQIGFTTGGCYHSGVVPS